MFSMHRLFVGLMLIALLVGACQPIQAPAPKGTQPTRQALRPDTPPYGVRGPYYVGHRALVSSERNARPLAVSIWYPALNPMGAREEITYQFKPKNSVMEGNNPSIVHGHALLDAPVDAAQSPYPLVVFSHGFGLNPGWYSTLVEHYASHGFVVLAPDHVEQEWEESALSLIDRPRDIKQTLDYAAALTAPGGELAGVIDLANIAVVGHSYGGYTALAMGGAQIDLATFNQHCATLAPDDPMAFLCVPFVDRDSALAERAGLASVPEGLWPSLGDPRVTAIIPLAGDAFLFDKAGLSTIKIPMMAIGGTADTGTPYAWGSKLAYDHTSSAQKILVGLQSAEHMIMSTPCTAMPWITESPYYAYLCFDPVWDKQRALDLIHHFSTAFLLDVLKEDPTAHEMLLPEAVQFAGIEYETTLR